MSLFRALTGVASLALLLIVCAEADERAVETSSGAGLSTTTSIVEREDGWAVRVHPGSWRIVGVTGGGRTLRVQVGIGGCTDFDHFEVAESTDRVEVVAVMHTALLPAEGDDGLAYACTSELGLPIEEIRLDTPLGDRRLVGECRGAAPTCDTFGPPPPTDSPG